MRKVPSFTILETIIALLILMTIFGITALVLSRVLDSKSLAAQFEAHAAMTALAAQTKTTHDFVATQKEYSAFTLRRDIDYYKGDKRLLLLTITATNKKGRQIDSYREIISAKK